MALFYLASRWIVRMAATMAATMVATMAAKSQSQIENKNVPNMGQPNENLENSIFQ